MVVSPTGLGPDPYIKEPEALTVTRVGCWAPNGCLTPIQTVGVILKVCRVKAFSKVVFA
jgi:hypothetical protein